jgi:hypothetical protein
MLNISLNAFIIIYFAKIVKNEKINDWNRNNRNQVSFYERKVRSLENGITIITERKLFLLNLWLLIIIGITGIWTYLHYNPKK